MYKVSIVTVCYNAEETIERTIKSVLEQSYTDFEYIIIDGKSTDNTYNKVCSYTEKFKQKKIKYVHISEKDNGIFDAMNKGIVMAQGEYINFMNADDRFHNQDVLKEIISKNRKADVIYGNTYRVEKDKKWMTKGKNIEVMSQNMPFCHQSSFVKTNIMKNSLFDLKYRVADYNFFLRLYLAGGSFEYVDTIIADYSMEGFSNQEKYKTYLGTLKIKEDLNLINTKSIKQRLRNIYFKLLLSDGRATYLIKKIDYIYRKKIKKTEEC